MFTESYFMKTQELLHRGMNNSLVRRKVISDNIANVDVPHFKRSEVLFEENLKRAIDSEKTQAINAVPTQISDDRHFEFFKALDYKDVKPKVNLDYLTTMRADGNNVDIEKEMTEASHNQMSYMILAERLNQNFKQLNIVMRLA
ncbi:MAG: flagellar basal body rod protein FlgB [Leptospira sp.]|nr:flagellar basal body rod protein FlgB [Leptospira sp.]